MMEKLLFIALLHMTPDFAAGHAFISFPMLRGGNAPNSVNGYCPQCLGSVDLPMPICGNSQMLAYADGPTTKLKAGEKVEFHVKVTAHHKGHFQLRICDQQLTPSTSDPEACLNKHVLERVRPEEIHSDCKADDRRGDCQPYDEANPGYWYLPPPGWGDTAQIAGRHFTDADANRTMQTDFVEHASMIQLHASASMQKLESDESVDVRLQAGIEYKFHYWIPKSFKCDKCTLQWAWKSANSCNPHPDAYNCYFEKMNRLVGLH
jgi:hypothetical protein